MCASITPTHPELTPSADSVQTKFDITFIAKGYANVDEGTKPTGKYDATITTRVEGPGVLRVVCCES